jgi:hypothetical protein
MRKLLGILVMVAIASVGLAKGLPDWVKYDAPATSMLKDGTSVKYKLTHASAEEMKVRITVINMGSQLMMLDKEGIQIKLPDGKLVKRSGMKSGPLIINPGKSEDISNNYAEKGRDLRVEKATIVVGGVSFANDPTQRVVGEIPLVQNGAAD